MIAVKTTLRKDLLRQKYKIATLCNKFDSSSNKFN